MRRLALTVCGLLVAIVMAIGTPATASTISYALTIDHCTGGCGGAVATVALDDHDLTGSVDVSVTLTPGVDRFMASGLDATFAWNLTNNVTVTTPGLPGTYTLLNGGAPGTLHMDGFGSFEYGVQNNTGNGSGNSLLGPLTFTVQGTGLTIGSFASNSTGGAPSVFFAVDIYSPSTGNTGPLGGSTCITCGTDLHLVATPEPASLVLLGSGLLAATRRLRRVKR